MDRLGSRNNDIQIYCSIAGENYHITSSLLKMKIKRYEISALMEQFWDHYEKFFASKRKGLYCFFFISDHFWTLKLVMIKECFSLIPSRMMLYPNRCRCSPPFLRFLKRHYRYPYQINWIYRWCAVIAVIRFTS